MLKFATVLMHCQQVQRNRCVSIVAKGLLCSPRLHDFCDASDPARLMLTIGYVQVELTSFLRKAHRPLRQASLDTLEAVAAKYGPQLAADPIATTVAEASNLISDSDLSLTSLALELLVTLLKQQPAAAGPAAAAKTLPPALVLVKSPLLQGSASMELQAFFPALAASGAPGVTPEELVDVLLKEGLSSSAGRHAQHSIAQCLAVLCTGADGKGLQSLVDRLLAMTSSKDSGDQQVPLRRCMNLRAHLFCGIVLWSVLVRCF